MFVHLVIILESKLIDDTILNIAQYDFPEKWSDLFPAILNKFQNLSSYEALFGSLIALKSVLKSQEYLNGKDRLGLEQIVQETFPLLENCIENLLGESNPKVDDVGLLIFKIFFAAINV